MTGYIQFVANYEDWQSVKKLTVDEKMDPRTIMEFLASLNTGLDRKVENNLAKIVDLKAVDALVQQETDGKGRSEQAIASVLAALKGAKLGAIIKEEIAKHPEMQKNVQGEISDFIRAYATRKALKALGIMADYSEIEIPGMKRAMKKKA